MIQQILLISAIFIGQLAFAQKVKTIDLDKVCDPIAQQYHYEVEDVDEFKDSLTLTIELTTVTDGRDVDYKAKRFTEKIKDESSIIMLSKTVAFSIAIARITEHGKKYYLYSIHLYRKDGKCWDDLNTNGTWSKCSLGTITSGYGFGNQGTSNFIGFSGSVRVK
jgi:hypothetical protein